MVDEIYEYISNLHGNHTLCYFMLERMTDIRKPSKTLKPLKSKLPTRLYKIIFGTLFSMLWAESFRNRLPR